MNEIKRQTNWDGGNVFGTSTDEWVMKIWYKHTMEYYLAIKKARNSAICDNEDRT